MIFTAIMDIEKNKYIRMMAHDFYAWMFQCEGVDAFKTGNSIANALELLQSFTKPLR